MEKTNYWEKFQGSGKIEDYLEYKQSNNISNEGLKSLDTGAKVYATVERDNGNDIKNSAYR